MPCARDTQIHTKNTHKALALLQDWTKEWQISTSLIWERSHNNSSWRPQRALLWLMLSSSSVCAKPTARPSAQEIRDRKQSPTAQASDLTIQSSGNAVQPIAPRTSVETAGGGKSTAAAGHPPDAHLERCWKANSTDYFKKWNRKTQSLPNLSKLLPRKKCLRLLK